MRRDNERSDSIKFSDREDLSRVSYFFILAEMNLLRIMNLILKEKNEEDEEDEDEKDEKEENNEKEKVIKKIKTR